MDNWPFPPPGGPIPWTAEQERQYQREQAQKQRDQMEEAPW